MSTLRTLGSKSGWGGGGVRPWGLANDRNPIARAGQAGPSHWQWASHPGPATWSKAPTLSGLCLLSKAEEAGQQWTRNPGPSDSRDPASKQTNHRGPLRQPEGSQSPKGPQMTEILHGPMLQLGKSRPSRPETGSKVTPTGGAEPGLEPGLPKAVPGGLLYSEHPFRVSSSQ